MPRLRDPHSPYAFLREAAFVIVLDRGPSALSRRALAAALGISDATVRRLTGPGVDLRSFATAEVTRRRRLERRRRSLPTPQEQACHILRELLPDEPRRVAEELVALKINVDLAPTPPEVARVDEDGLTLAEGGRLGLTGRRLEPAAGASDPDPSDPDTRDPETRDPDTRDPDTIEPDTIEPELDPYVARFVTERRELAALVVGEAMDVLEVPASRRDHVAELLLTLVIGLNLRTCLGELTSDDALAVLRAEIGDLAVRSSAA